MKKVLFIENYELTQEWDKIVMREIYSLETRPIGWTDPALTQKPEGDWMLYWGCNQHYPNASFVEFGLPGKPEDSQCPAIFCVDKETGEISSMTKVDASKAIEFIRSKIQ